MPNLILERDHLWFHREVERLKAEVAALKSGLADLEQKAFRSHPLVQKLGRALGFGAAGKLEWARFKLNFKQEELDRFRSEEMPEVTLTRRAPSADNVRETILSAVRLHQRSSTTRKLSE